MAKFFPPTITTAQRTAITPDKGEIMFDSDLDTFYLGDGSTLGGITLKGDTGDVGPPGPLGAVVDDTSPQLGGFLDPNGNYIGMGKGGDIASSSPLVIDIDGDYFDITGTNSFSTMTVIENRFFILEFDAVLTITHGGSITLPGSTNFTTAAGDHLLCFSTAANTVRVVAITKADGSAVVSGLFNVSEDTTPQLGGFLDPNGNYIGSEKGGDIASSSPLTIGTNGDYFDVTGTTGFSTMTVAVNRLFRLQFDGILTITHGGSITLPGSANFTTAAGDEITFFSTATNTVRVVAITKADGTPVISPNGGGAWNLIGTIEASDDATLTITGLDSTYDTYAIGLSDLIPATGTPIAHLRVGDSGGIDSGSTDYNYVYHITASTNPTIYTGSGSIGDTHIKLGGVACNAFGGMLFLHRPGDGDSFPSISGTCAPQNSNDNSQLCVIAGHRTAVITLDRIQFLFSSGNVSTGRMTIWGLSHE